jgi:hypothetical protein
MTVAGVDLPATASSVKHGRRHLERVLRTYTAHYNTRRPHRGLDLKTPDPWPDPPPLTKSPRVRKQGVLGGLIHEYELAA